MQTDHPGISEFGYHYFAIYYARDGAALEAAAESIRKTVPKDHKELPFLREAYKVRQDELRQPATITDKD